MTMNRDSGWRKSPMNPGAGAGLLLLLGGLLLLLSGCSTTGDRDAEAGKASCGSSFAMVCFPSPVRAGSGSKGLLSAPGRAAHPQPARNDTRYPSVGGPVRRSRSSREGGLLRPGRLFATLFAVKCPWECS